MRPFIFVFLFLSYAAYQGSSQVAPGYQSMMDNAWIRFIYNKAKTPGPDQLISTYILSECYHCLDQLITNFSATDPSSNSNVSYMIFPTNYTGTFYIYANTTPVGTIGPYGQSLVSIDYDIDQNGNYTILVTDNYDSVTGDWKNLNIQVLTDVDGDNIWVPVFIAAAIFIGPTIAYNLFLYWRKKQKQTKVHEGAEYVSQDNSAHHLILNSRPNSVSPNNESPQQPEKPARKNMKERLQSLDTFRGTALAIMLFVNSGAGAYVQLDHSAWNGLHLADLVFPWFIWMMGVSMAISFASQRKRGASNRDMVTKAAIRTFKLAFFNMMMNGTKAADHLRIPGVLMRFAISYFVIALIVIYVPTRKSEKEGTSPYAFLTDHIYELIPIGVMLGLWLGLTFGLKVPGCPTGYIGPGGLIGDYGAYQNCTGGAAGYIDLQFLGLNHIYQHPTAQPIYLLSLIHI